MSQFIFAVCYALVVFGIGFGVPALIDHGQKKRMETTRDRVMARTAVRRAWQGDMTNRERLIKARDDAHDKAHHGKAGIESPRDFGNSWRANALALTTPARDGLDTMADQLFQDVLDAGKRVIDRIDRELGLQPQVLVDEKFLAHAEESIEQVFQLQKTNERQAKRITELEDNYLNMESKYARSEANYRAILNSADEHGYVHVLKAEDYLPKATHHKHCACKRCAMDRSTSQLYRFSKYLNDD